jgi:tripartite-type tricarboxylate transporter receptor subunit TctC
MPTARALLGALALCLALPALGQSYPSKPVRIVSPFPPGGSVDVVGRMLAAKLTDSLGQQVIVDNRSGASGNIGTEHVARAAPDGYTLLIHTIPLVTNQFLMSRVPYDALKDFAPIMHATSSPSLVTVHPSLPARSIKELIALARARPGQLDYSAAGVGTNPHIAGELFNLLAGINLVAIQFKGGGPADMAVISGECEVAFGNISQQIGYVSARRLRALAITSARRSPIMPHLPTVAEAGLPGYEFVTWHGLLAPQATPRSIIALLNERLKRLLTDPRDARLWRDRGLDVVAGTPEQFAAHLFSEQEKWGKVIRERGIKAE